MKFRAGDKQLDHLEFAHALGLPRYPVVKTSLFGRAAQQAQVVQRHTQGDFFACLVFGGVGQRQHQFAPTGAAGVQAGQPV